MLRRAILFAFLAGAIAAVVMPGGAAGRTGRTADSIFDGNWQSTRGEMILRAANTIIDFGEYGDTQIGRLCGVHVTPADDPRGFVLSGFWYEGGPTFTITDDGLDCGPIKSSPWGRFFFKPSADGKTLTGKFETHGDGLPLGNTDKWPAWNATKSGSSGGTGGTSSTLPTSSTPFGTPTTGAVALGAVIDVPSPSLPPNTTEVDASAEFSDADIAKLAAALKVAIAAYNRRKTLEALSYYCLVFVPDGDSNSLGLNNFASAPGACDKFAAVVLKKGGGKRFLQTASSRCATAFVPFWKPGSRVTTQQHNLALAVARSEVQATCTSTKSGRVALKVVARGKTTLNQVLGKSVQAGVGATGSPSGTPQLTVTWAKPRTTVTPSGGKAKPGHYTGTTNESKPLSFDVTSDVASVTNLKVAGNVDCTDTTSWSWTMSFTGKSPISPSLRFSHSYSGALTISSTTVTNVKVTYALSGALTSSGTASGNFRISHITWDASGKHYTCSGAAVTWTARLG